VKRLQKIWVDQGYDAQWLCDWVRGLKQTHKIDLEVVEHTSKGFQIVKQRWKVERTLAWLLTDRHHSRDYERLTASSAAMIQTSMIRNLAGTFSLRIFKQLLTRLWLLYPLNLFSFLLHVWLLSFMSCKYMEKNLFRR
jgi:transposase